MKPKVKKRFKILFVDLEKGICDELEVGELGLEAVKGLPHIQVLQILD